MTMPSASHAKAGWRTYLDRRLITILVMGFASGLPFLLTSVTLSAWLAQAGIAKTLIGFMSWASSVYALKFLWSPIVDRTPIPILTKAFGQRRAWMLVSQGMCMAAMVGLGLTNPADSLALTAAWVVALAFASATQDIVIDAYRIEYLEQSQYGAGAAMTTLGYRIGVLASGGGALLIADSAGWAVSYAVMAALMLIGVGITLLSQEPSRSSLAAAGGSYSDWIYRAVIQPLAEFMTRPGWLPILAFIALYKYGDALLAVMSNPFYIDIGFTLTQIGLVTKTYGVGMTLFGSFVGGLIVMRYGIMPTLLWGGIAMGLSNLLYVALAFAPNVPTFVAVISVENFANGVGSVAAIAYLSSLCNLAFTATQYALMTSFMAFTRTILASGGGWLADRIDWVTYFTITTFAAIPGIILLLWMMRRYPAQGPAVAPNTLADD
jgi:MFS transporter, PAT family, beta-lactamase induction signal transducer AmpG